MIVASSFYFREFGHNSGACWRNLCIGFITVTGLSLRRDQDSRKEFEAWENEEIVSVIVSHVLVHIILVGPLLYSALPGFTNDNPSAQCWDSK